MIYFIKNSEYVKIGYTSKINQRLSQLQVSSPFKLEVIGLVDGGVDKETEYQKKFLHLAVNGEWFNYTKELESFIEELDKSLLWKHGFVKNDNSLKGLIHSCRLECNLTLEELGEKLGITKQAIKDIETRDLQGRISVGAIHKALNAMGYKFEFRALKIKND